MKNNIIWLIAKITFKESIRSKVLYGIGLLSGFLFISNLFITQFFSLEIGKVAIDVGFSVLSLAGLSIIFFLGIGLLSKDLHQKNICMIICHPVSRFEYVVGKFSGLALFLMVTMGILGVCAILSLWMGTYNIEGLKNLHNFSWGIFFYTVFFNFLSLLTILAVGFLFTAITTSGYLSMILTFFVYIIGHTLDTIIKVLVKADFVQMDTFILKGLKLVSWILPNLSALDFKTHLAYGLPQDPVYLIWLTCYGILYTCIVLVATGVFLHFKDIS